MSKGYLVGALLASAVTASPALAQDNGPDTYDRVSTTSGRTYGVLRAGVQIDSDLRFRGPDAAAPSTLPRNTDLKRGFTGEAGVGYDFGGFRLEGTAGYNRSVVDRDRASGAIGRQKSFDLGVAGYVDLNPNGTVRPYIGGGVGASRVVANVSRLIGTPAAGARFRDRDWGFRWHADAGIGFQASPSTVVELGARYHRTTALAFDGATGPASGTGTTARTFKPRLSGTSVMVGLRQSF